MPVEPAIIFKMSKNNSNRNNSNDHNNEDDDDNSQTPDQTPSYSPSHSYTLSQSGTLVSNQPTILLVVCFIVLGIHYFVMVPPPVQDPLAPNTSYFQHPPIQNSTAANTSIFQPSSVQDTPVPNPSILQPSHLPFSPYNHPYGNYDPTSGTFSYNSQPFIGIPNQLAYQHVN